MMVTAALVDDEESEAEEEEGEHVVDAIPGRISRVQGAGSFAIIVTLRPRLFMMKNSSMKIAPNGSTPTASILGTGRK